MQFFDGEIMGGGVVGMFFVAVHFEYKNWGPNKQEN